MAVGRLRRSDRTMSEEDTVVLLRRALVGRIGTVDADGTPYVVPLNFVYEHAARRIHLHFARQPGHLTSNLKFSSKVCFEVDEPGPSSRRARPAARRAKCTRALSALGELRWYPRNVRG